jgi:hypothetical protein
LESEKPKKAARDARLTPKHRDDALWINGLERQLQASILFRAIGILSLSRCAIVIVTFY